MHSKPLKQSLKQDKTSFEPGSSLEWTWPSFQSDKTRTQCFDAALLWPSVCVPAASDAAEPCCRDTHSVSPASVSSFRFCAFMGELFVWGFGYDFYAKKRSSIFSVGKEMVEVKGSTSRSKVVFWDDVLPPPCKEKLSGVNGNGNESALLHHITQLL